MIIPIDNLGEFGLIQDIYPTELALNAWSKAKNFTFREGFAEKAFGHVAVNGTPLVPPWHLANFLSVAGNTWLYAGLEKIYGIDPDTVHTNITRQTAGNDVDYSNDPNNKWNSTMLSGIVILNNGQDIPQFWAGTGRCADLTNWPGTTRAKVVRAFRNYLIALNITESGNNYPHLMKWSHHADPGTVPSTWDVADPTKDAGEYDLADDQTELVDGMVLGEQFIAYKRSGYYSVQFIGSPLIFRIQKISGLYGGALSSNCVTEFPAGHFVLGRGDVYAHQGGAPESVIDGKNRKWLFKQLDSANQQRAFTTLSPASNELWICFPQLSDEYCTTALVWNWKYNTWGPRDLPGIVHACAGSVNYSQPNTWETLNLGWQAGGVSWNQNISTLPSTNTVLASPANTKMYAIELTGAFDGTSYESYVERTHITFGKPRSTKFLKELRPLIEGPINSTVDIYISAAYDQTADPTIYGPYPFVIGVDQHIDCAITGRMLGFKFVATDSFAWRIKQFEVDVTEIGDY